MKKWDISLPTHTLLQLPFNYYTKDFVFIINNMQYHTNRIFADILSPKIRNLHFIDETIEHIFIQTQNDGDFNDVLKLLSQKNLQISESQIPFFIEIFGQMENYDLIRAIDNPDDETTIKNVVDRLNIKMKLNMNIDKEISFISSHFTVLSNKLLKLNVSIIERIITNQNLVVKSEDYLLNFILSLKRIDQSQLFQYINFQNLSASSMQKFVSNFDMESMNISIWNSLCNRLQLNVIPIYNEKQTQKIISKVNKSYISCHNNATDKGKKTGDISSVNNDNNFIDSVNSDKAYLLHLVDFAGNMLDGIVHEIINNYGKNQISVSASSYYSQSYVPENLLEFNNNDLFGSQNKENQWVIYDFCDFFVELKHYSIKTSNFWGENGEHLRSWVVECSTNKKKWTTIDRQENIEVLNGKGNVQLFNTIHVKMARYIRIKQTGPNWKGNNCLNLSAVEFFGNLYVPQVNL
ncbi:hypothetical protein TRFO_11169 [Tritrichomonas foetus]|uniref:F5/8 type C domain-containing protein n=1 Tax=Tritrichomonas foetus TaxID=1144522 RepID=A0A1J4JAN1_9EUKA|nr:hypothetical protein TRFO_11169 [Tritrichomonas foetus]|eukprot:OHS94316.1 hypothetical protein TRFO_11169 [Tritrichomonas foetus]